MRKQIFKSRSADLALQKEDLLVKKYQARASYIGLSISVFALLLSIANTIMVWKQIDQQKNSRIDAYGSGYYQSKVNAFSEFSDDASHLYGILLSFYVLGSKKSNIPAKEVNQIYSVIQKYTGEYSSSFEKARFFMSKNLEKNAYAYTKFQANALDCTNTIVHDIELNCDFEELEKFIQNEGAELEILQKSLRDEISPGKAVQSN